MIGQICMGFMGLFSGMTIMYLLIENKIIKIEN